MKKYYIQVKNDNKDNLAALIEKHLSLPGEIVRYLISIGAVWDKNTNQRLKDPGYICHHELVVIHKPAYKVPLYHFHEQDIVYEEPDFMIVYKKGKYPTVPTPYSDVNSLSYALQNFCNQRKSGSAVYVINRLDTHTRGLVFFAKNKKTERLLHAMFAERRIKKWYTAKTAPFEGVKNNYLIRDTLEWNGKVKNAETYIHLLEKSDSGYCFLIRPHTGRTHQIRKHCAAYLSPVIGDPVYGNNPRHADMALICFAYVFPHPVTGKKMVVKYPFNE
jgi:23S rRNA-/tRNA-specific pseudouridylate synthase